MAFDLDNTTTFNYICSCSYSIRSDYSYSDQLDNGLIGSEWTSQYAI